MKTIIQNISSRRVSEKTKMKQSVTEAISKKLENEDFTFLSGHTLYTLLLDDATDLHEAWARFKDSWNSLKRDTFMADGGRYVSDPRTTHSYPLADAGSFVSVRAIQLLYRQAFTSPVRKRRKLPIGRLSQI